MKALSIESTIVLNQMTGMMEDFCARIDNSKGQFMPVYVALFNKYLGNRIISVGHYKSIDGEIIANPEMRFMFDEEDNQYYPIYYRQDCLDVIQESVKTVGGEVRQVRKSLQEEHAKFADIWLRNIKKQQNL